MSDIEEGEKLWEPGTERRGASNLADYQRWLESTEGIATDSYHDLWEWSVDDIEAFWESIWRYYDVDSHAPYQQVLASRALPGDDAYTGTNPGRLWFQGTELNYTEHVLRNRTDDHPALIADSESGPRSRMEWDELADQVAAVASAFRDLGVEPGDRIVGFLPHVPEAVVAFLASASIGAVWSCCSPDFGATSVLSRFQQLDPTVFVFCDGYEYGGTEYPKAEIVSEVRDSLPSLEASVLVETIGLDTEAFADARAWEDLVAAGSSDLDVEPVPFDHPLWVLFSSGTTGPPKPIVQGHGGILLEHLKVLGLHTDLSPGDRFFWYTSTGWMMWNYLVSGLLVGATPILYDGDPTYPDLNVLWEFAEETEMNVFGTSASYLLECMHREFAPGEEHDLCSLEAIGQTASPLPPEGFEYVYENIKADVWFSSVSGGTDLCTGFLAGAPLLPVHAGEIQCRALGANVQVYDETGSPVVGTPGELVLADPMPSMPICFWGDEDDERLTQAYFQKFPGVWRHGDFMKLTDRESAVIYGRSDAVINKQGVRFGPSEVYAAIDGVDGIVDSLATGVERPDGSYFFPLSVVLEEDRELDDEFVRTIESAIRTQLTPRHVPDRVYEIEAVPRNLTGKKLEVPVKHLLQGMSIDDAVNLDAVENPEALEAFLEIDSANEG